MDTGSEADRIAPILAVLGRNAAATAIAMSSAKARSGLRRIPRCTMATNVGLAALVEYLQNDRLVQQCAVGTNG